MKKQIKLDKLNQADGREKPSPSKVEAVSNQKPDASKKCICKFETK